MATVAELERLAALTNRLVPLADMRQGTLIRADDWNLLVGAVLELARAVLAEESGGTVGDHEHVEEIDIGWLTPRLRALIEQGGLADPVSTRRLTTIERDGQKLKTQVDLLQSELDKIRVNLNDVKIRDIGRTSDFTILRRKFEAQSDVREEVLDLRATLGTIQENIGRALEVGDSLTVDGELPNFDELFSRVSGLEALRQRLTNPDGTLLDASTLAIRLAELQGTFVTQDQLDDALDDVRTRPPQDLIDRLTVDLQSVMDGRLATAREEQRAEFDQRYTRQEQLDQRLNDLTTQVRTETISRVDTLRGELMQQFVTQNGLESRLDGFGRDQENVLGQLVQRQLTSRLDELMGSLDQRYLTDATLSQRLGSFGTALQRQIIEAVRGDMEARVVATLEGRGRELFISNEQYNAEQRDVRRQLEELSRRVSSPIDDLLPQLAQRFATLEVLNERVTPLENRTITVPDEVIQRHVDVAVERVVGDLDARLNALDGLESRLSSTMSNQINTLRQELSRVAQQAVATQVQGIQNSLATLQGQVVALNTRIDRGIRDEVTTHLRDATAALQAEFNTIKQTVARLSLRPNLDPAVGPSGAPVELSAAPPAVATSADFTVLTGIGSTFARRLHDAGIHTFAELADLSDDALANVLETSVGQIRRRSLQTQAAARR